MEDYNGSEAEPSVFLVGAATTAKDAVVSQHVDDEEDATTTPSEPEATELSSVPLDRDLVTSGDEDEADDEFGDFASTVFGGAGPIENARIFEDPAVTNAAMDASFGDFNDANHSTLDGLDQVEHPSPSAEDPVTKDDAMDASFGDFNDANQSSADRVNQVEHPSAVDPVTNDSMDASFGDFNDANHSTLDGVNPVEQPRIEDPIPVTEDVTDASFGDFTDGPIAALSDVSAVVEHHSTEEDPVTEDAMDASFGDFNNVPEAALDDLKEQSHDNAYRDAEDNTIPDSCGSVLADRLESSRSATPVRINGHGKAEGLEVGTTLTDVGSSTKAQSPLGVLADATFAGSDDEGVQVEYHSSTGRGDVESTTSAPMEHQLVDDDFGDFDAAPTLIPTDQETGFGDFDDAPPDHLPVDDALDNMGEFGDFDDAAPAGTDLPTMEDDDDNDDDDDFGDFDSAPVNTKESENEASTSHSHPVATAHDRRETALSERARSVFSRLFASHLPSTVDATSKRDNDETPEIISISTFLVRWDLFGGFTRAISTSNKVVILFRQTTLLTNPVRRIYS